MRAFANDLSEGDIRGDSAMLAAYGIYLMHGGRPKDFMDLKPDDIQIMFTTYIGLMRRQADMIALRMWGKEE